MKVIAILLIVFGVISLILSTMMFGDIGISAAIGAIVSLLSGFGFLQVNKQLKKTI